MGLEIVPLLLKTLKIPRLFVASALEGESARSEMRVAVNDHSEVPKEIKLRNEDVALCADVMFIQQVPFSIAVSEKLKFIAIVPIASRSNDNPLEAFDSKPSDCR